MLSNSNLHKVATTVVIYAKALIDITSKLGLNFVKKKGQQAYYKSAMSEFKRKLDLHESPVFVDSLKNNKKKWKNVRANNKI